MACNIATNCICNLEVFMMISMLKLISMLRIMIRLGCFKYPIHSHRCEADGTNINLLFYYQFVLFQKDRVGVMPTLFFLFI